MYYYILEIPSRSERLVECELSVESVRSESVSSDSEFVGKLLVVRPEFEPFDVEAISNKIYDNHIDTNANNIKENNQINA